MSSTTPTTPEGVQETPIAASHRNTPDLSATGKVFWAPYKCPLGVINLHFEDNALTAVDFPSSRHGMRPLPATQSDVSNPVVKHATAQLDEYFAGTLGQSFCSAHQSSDQIIHHRDMRSSVSVSGFPYHDDDAGKRKVFEMDLKPRGAPFDERVWNALLKVPFGTTVSYGELAIMAGAPGAARKSCIQYFSFVFFASDPILCHRGGGQCGGSQSASNLCALSPSNRC